MKLVKDNFYCFKFIGQQLKGKFVEKKILWDGEILYKFTDGKLIYSIKKENICGNSKQ
jgi:hypothetical protein